MNLCVCIVPLKIALRLFFLNPYVIINTTLVAARASILAVQLTVSYQTVFGRPSRM
jgi:hypothetical protein